MRGKQTALGENKSLGLQQDSCIDVYECPEAHWKYTGLELRSEFDLKKDLGNGL